MNPSRRSFFGLLAAAPVAVVLARETEIEIDAAIPRSWGEPSRYWSEPYKRPFLTEFEEYQETLRALAQADMRKYWCSN